MPKDSTVVRALGFLLYVLSGFMFCRYLHERWLLNNVGYNWGSWSAIEPGKATADALFCAVVGLVLLRLIFRGLAEFFISELKLK